MPVNWRKKMEGEIKEFPRYKKAKRIYHHQTSLRRNVSNHQENADKTTKRCHLITVRMAVIKKTIENK